MAKIAQQCIFFLHQLKKFRVNKSILTQFYRAVTESVLTFSITVWYGSVAVHNKNMLEGIVEIKDHWLKTSLVESDYTNLTLHKATTIISDSIHTANHLFESFSSVKRFRSIKSRTTCFSNGFYPKAVQIKSPNTTPKE